MGKVSGSIHPYAFSGPTFTECSSHLPPFAPRYAWRPSPAITSSLQGIACSVIKFPAKMQCWGEETYAQCGWAADGAHQDALEPLSKPPCSASRLVTRPSASVDDWAAHFRRKPISATAPVLRAQSPVCATTTAQQAPGSCWMEPKPESWKGGRS